MRLLSELRLLTLMALIAVTLTACGKKGDLTLPAAEQTTIQPSLSLAPTLSLAPAHALHSLNQERP
ncbi:LPS translocon maturation chaperone LptM [Thiomicrorhabdus aquaedulcis]|uniref:LPS translocon maturation chaperone LptM n=1 Tax=Thiomicrorhabdus aquaedulcis TaxID=2211106 RepID=UPI000FD89B4B|nr:lipoprotein [Thiomicrorhabdus aquaedulcis]